MLATFLGPLPGWPAPPSPLSLGLRLLPSWWEILPRERLCCSPLADMESSCPQAGLSQKLLLQCGTAALCCAQLVKACQNAAF